MQRALTVFAATLLLVTPLAFVHADISASVQALSPSATVPLGTQVSFIVLSSGFTVRPSYSIIDSFPGGINSNYINQLNGNFFWTPNASDIGTHNLTITLSDSNGSTTQTTQSIMVTSAPTLGVQGTVTSFSVSPGVPVTFTLVPTAFVSTVKYSTKDSASPTSIRGTEVNNQAVFYWTPLYSDIGTHAITVTAADATYTATTSVQVTVLANASLSIQSVSPGTNVGVGQKVTFAAAAQGLVSPTYTLKDSFSYPSSSTPSIDAATGKGQWTPMFNDIGTHPLTIVATDSTGRAATTTLQLFVSQQYQSYIPTPVLSTSTAPTSVISSGASPAAVSGGHTFSIFLTVGSSNSDVTALQTILTKLGFYNGPVTGYFGLLTKAALQKFQTAHGLEAVGYAGPGTRKTLSAAQ